MIDREDSPDLFDMPEPQVAPPAVTVAAASRAAAIPAGATLGARLRATREAQDLDLATCARRLHLPAMVLEKLEADDFGQPEHFVFRRGALLGYARLLGVPAASCDVALRVAAPAAQPALVSVARISPARWLLQRYGTAATYIVLTATIAVPLVLLGLRGGLERPATRIVSLDQAQVPAQRPAPGQKVAIDPPAAQPDTNPFRASMTPFAAIGLNSANATVGAGALTPAPVPALVAGQHTLTISATADCWFEITDAEGNKIASGMLHAGDSRTWNSPGALHVTLGNAGAVSVTSDGHPLSMEPFQRANVARFDVFAASTESGGND